jgi:EmrB/QacA subfamily drug resistance transporter
MTDTSINWKRIIFIIAVMVSGGFITNLNQTVLTPALPKIMEETGVSLNTGQWLTTVFLLVAAIMIPLTAYFINKFPTRRLFMGAMFSFAVGSLLCAISGSFSIILFGRVLQAAGAGIMMPLCQTVVMLLVPINKRGTAMGIIGLVMALAPAVGPTIAGWVIDVWGWHLMFYIITALSVIDIILAFFVLENAVETSDPKLDMRSVLYSSVGLSAFLYGCSYAGDYGLTPLSIILLLAGVAVLALFVKRQLELEEPFLNLRILKYREFMLATVIVMIIYACLICGSVLMPIFMQNIQGLSAMQSGLAMMPGAVCMGVLNILSGWIFDKQGPRKLAITGLSLLSFSCACFIFLQANTAFFIISIVYTLRMVGIAMAMMPITTWGLNTLSKQLMPHGTAINNTLRQVAGSLGTTFFVAVMSAVAELHANEGYIAANLRGIQVSFTLITLLCLTALALTIIFVRQPKSAGVLKVKKNN